LNEQAEIHIMMLEFTPFHRFTLLQPPFGLIHTRHHSRDNLQRRSAHSNDSITEEEWTTLIQGYITYGYKTPSKYLTQYPILMKNIGPGTN
jgi:hypothetical protein